MPRDISPELRQKLEARGLDPERVYESLLEDVERMLFEIRAGSWDFEEPRRACVRCGSRYPERSVSCRTCQQRVFYRSRER